MKNFKTLSKAEMRKIAGGDSVECPVGTCWNETIQACDWEFNGECSESSGEGPKITACKGLVKGDPCGWTNAGHEYTGRCGYVAPSYTLYCQTAA